MTDATLGGQRASEALLLAPDDRFLFVEYRRPNRCTEGSRAGQKRDRYACSSCSNSNSRHRRLLSGDVPAGSSGGLLGCCRRRSGDAARCRKERSGSALGHSSLMDVRFRSPRAHEPCSDARCASGSDSQPATLSLRGDGSLHAHPTSLSTESSTTTENPLPALSSRGLLIFNIAAKSPTARTTPPSLLPGLCSVLPIVPPLAAVRLSLICLPSHPHPNSKTVTRPGVRLGTLEQSLSVPSHSAKTQHCCRY